MFDEFGFAMNPDGAFAPRWRGGPMRLHGGKGGDSAPAPDPALLAAQIKSMGIQDNMISQIMGNTADMAPLQKEQLRFGLDSAKTAYGQSQEDRSWMLGRRGQLSGLQDTLSADAAGFNAAGRQDELAGQATADVGMAFDNARQQQSRGLERSGVAPGSGKSLALMQQGSLAEAKAKAGAFTKTREAARLEGYSLTDRASNALAGYPAMGMAATGAGAGFGASGLGMANSGLAGLNSGLTSAGTMAGQMGSNATGMFGAQGSYQNAAGANAGKEGSAIMGLVGTVGGAFLGGPAGAAIGGKLGSMVG